MNTSPYDVIVIGGGPAGMMAAGVAASRGLSVLLLEKNATLGKKLLITGGGRCNVTNAEPDLRTLLGRYTGSTQFLFSTFAQFDNIATLDFFHKRNMPTKTEENGRVFPVSDSAASVLAVLTKYLHDGKVTVRTGAVVQGITHTASHISGVKLATGEIIEAPSYILATGGLSRPETGSTGDGFAWLKNLGHTVYAPNPSLVPITLHDTWIRTVSGVSLPSVKVTMWQGERVMGSNKGKLLFTHVGLSGPVILNMSKAIADILPHDPVTLTLDLFPDRDHGTLDTELVNLFHAESNKFFKNCLPTLLPSSLAEAIVTLSGIPEETPCHSISRESRRTLVHLLKAVPVSVKGLLGTDKAIVTSGGITLTEVNMKTMQSRLYSNLYLTGDILNIDRPSGGYSLQLCWTTGYVAGNSVPPPQSSK